MDEKIGKVRVADNTPTEEIEKSQIRSNVSIESNQRCGLKELIDFDSSELVDAVRIWSGWGQSSWPTRDDSRLRSILGTDRAERLLPTIKQLEKDFYSSDAYLNASDLAEVGKLAQAQFRLLHPSVAEEIVDIFAWCYTFDWR